MKAQPRPVILIALAFPPENLVGALRPGRFFKYLPEFGYSPWVVTASAEARGETILTVPAECPWWERLLWRIYPQQENLAWARPAAHAAAEIAAKHPGAIVVSTSPPVSTHLAALRLKQRFGIPWVADFRDPLTGNAVRGRRITPWVDAALERHLLAHADLVIANTEALRDYWSHRHPALAARIRVLCNGFDPQTVRDLRPLPAREQRLLTHVGSVYSARYAAQVFAALARLAAAGRLDPRQRVHMVGYIDRSVSDLAVAAELRARGILDIRDRHIPAEQAAQLMAESDFLLLFDYERRGGSLQCPAKLYDYIAAGRPILAVTNPGSPVERVLRISGIPHVCVYGSASDVEIDAGVLQLLSLSAASTRASEEYRKRFDGREQVRQLSLWLDEVAGR